MCACVRVIVSLPHASCTMLRSRNAVVTSAEYSRTRLRSRISYEIPRAHIPRATSRQLSLRESFCDESLLRVIARFPLTRRLSRMCLLTVWCTRGSGERIRGRPSIQDFGTETRDNGHLQNTHRDTLTELARACLSRCLAQETLTC